ncbi:MAG: hypothetical protein EDM05_027945 [Leptolyngbya sp. IPPAS B-1204]
MSTSSRVKNPHDALGASVRTIAPIPLPITPIPFLKKLNMTISDAGYTSPALGKYTACVKVIGTFGCDTSITVEVEV